MLFTKRSARDLVSGVHSVATVDASAAKSTDASCVTYWQKGAVSTTGVAASLPFGVALVGGDAAVALASSIAKQTEIKLFHAPSLFYLIFLIDS